MNGVNPNILKLLGFTPFTPTCRKPQKYYLKDYRYEYCKNYISNRINELQKYIHGKYFYFHFNEAIKSETQKLSRKKINVDIDNSKDNLARILKATGLSDDFINFERLLGIQTA